jgi:hypothetical protein
VSRLLTLVVFSLICMSTAVGADAGAKLRPQATIVWDTISTGRTRLVVSSVGEIGRMGNLGVGGVNLDYTGLGIDCDTAARVYLFDGGPFVMRQDSAGWYTWGTSFHQAAGTDHGFVPLDDVLPHHFTGPNCDAFTTGTFVVADSSIGMRATFYAPTDLGHLPHCAYGNIDSVSNDFVLAEYKIFCRSADTMHHVTIGLLDDWNIPSEPLNTNIPHSLVSKDMLCYSGSDTGGPRCLPYQARWGGSEFISLGTTWWFMVDPCRSGSWYLVQLVDRADSLTAHEIAGSQNLAGYLWQLSTERGFPTPPQTAADYYQMFALQHDSVLKPNDTIVLYMTYCSLRSGDTSAVKRIADFSRSWFLVNFRSCCQLGFGGTCCSSSGVTGNVDGDPGEGTDISDLSRLIDYLYVSFTAIDCWSAANVDGDPENRIDISDITRLIDYLYISFTPLACCH